MTKTKTYTAIVADRSGSMGRIKEEAEGGIRLFIEKLAGMKNAKNFVSLYQFDTEFDQVFGPVKAQDAPAYTLEPRGMTALYDAVGYVIQHSEQAIDALHASDRPDKVVLVVMTDGEENHSQEHTFETVQKLVADRQAAGWEIVFLAGTLKAQEFARASGLRANTRFNPGMRGQTYSVYASAANATTDYYAGETSSVEMPDDVSDKKADEKETWPGRGQRERRD